MGPFFCSLWGVGNSPWLGLLLDVGLAGLDGSFWAWRAIQRTDGGLLHETGPTHQYVPAVIQPVVVTGWCRASFRGQHHCFISGGCECYTQITTQASIHSFIYSTVQHTHTNTHTTSITVRPLLYLSCPLVLHCKWSSLIKSGFWELYPFYDSTNCKYLLFPLQKEKDMCLLGLHLICFKVIYYQLICAANNI